MDSDTGAEPFVRYQNAMYRVVSMVGAALIAILGVTGFVIGSTLDPVPPASFFIVDAAVTVVLFVWYLLGLRCRLDVAEDWVHAASKYGDTRVDRDEVVAIEADRSWWGSVQWSGRPLVLHHRVDGEVKTRRVYGCLPNAAVDQARVVEELQERLGRPDRTDRTDPDRMADAVGRHLDPGSGPTAADEPSDGLAAAVAERLARMTPEGDPADLGEVED